MSDSVHLSCVLCRNQITNKSASNCQFFCTKFFSYLRHPKILHTSGLKILISGDVGGNLRFAFCPMCQKLLMKFQVLQQRLRELRTLNAKHTAKLTLAAGRSLEAKKNDLDVRISGNSYTNGTMFDTAVTPASRDASVADLTVAMIINGDLISELNALWGIRREESVKENLGEVVDEVTAAPSESTGQCNADIPGPEALECLEPSDKAQGSCNQELDDMTKQSSKEAESLPSSSLGSASASSTVSGVPIRTKPLTSSKRAIKGNRKGKRTSKSTGEHIEESPSEAPKTVQSQTTRIPSREAPRIWYGGIMEVSQNKFFYLAKYPFDGTSYGYRCGSCDYYTTFSKSQDRFATIVKHIRRRHKETGGRQSPGNRRIIEVSPNHFMYGTFEFEKINGEFVCRQCFRSYTDRTKIGKHMKWHRACEERAEWICETCGKVLKTFNSFKHHKKTKHVEQQRATDVVCEECGKSFKCPSILKHHQDRVHLKRKPYTCTFCGRQFYSKNELLGHENAHKGEKSYECSKCDKKFSTPGSLWIHQLHHKGRKYKCDICDMEFTQLYSVTRHKNTAHPGWKQNKQAATGTD